MLKQWLLAAVCLAAFSEASLAQAVDPAASRAGRLEGRIVRPDGTPVSGVSVVLIETSAAALSDSNGRFTFGRLVPGVYSISLSLGENQNTVEGVSVSANAATSFERTVDWNVGFTETLVVSAPSRRVERIIDAPGSVTTVAATEIAQRAAHGQLPKLLEFSSGVQVTQSGLYDYNVNTRGFNSSLNRRVATLIDGRDPSIPLLGAQEWAALSFPLDDIAALEMLRGPSAALYGANASSGVLNVATKAPRDSLGGAVRVTAGQLQTVNVDFRWAHALGNGWFTKVVGGARRHDDYTVSRAGSAEYSVPCPTRGSVGCLPQEAVGLARAATRIFSGAARLDKYLPNGLQFVFEGGSADHAGPVFQTGIGRIQFLDVQRPWARVNVNSDRFNILASYTGRRGERQLALSSGANLADRSRRLQLEGQTNVRLAAGRVRLVAGASVASERVDTRDAQTGRQTVLAEPVTADKEAVFGQVDWSVTPTLKLVAASRLDFSSLHDARVSPKGSLVYSATTHHSVRFTYNEGFQVPNYSEYFLQVDAAPPANLGALNALCGSLGSNCGLGVTRVVAVGNPDLELETNRTWEIGYKGIFGGRAFVTVDFYRSRASDFVTDLVPQLGTALGRVNPRFGPWQPPAGVPEATAATIRSLAPPTLSNSADGSALLVAVSYSNFGDVDTQGVDAAVNYYLSERWRVSGSYSWFEFDIQRDLPGFDALLLPNTPAHTVSAGLSYDRPLLNVAADVRWVDAFPWSVGPFQGQVESYSTVDLNANVNVSPRVSVGLQLANLFDDRHWEAFGGDLLRRRALTHVKYAW